MYHLNNASFCLIACDLPGPERGFLPVDRRPPSDPKDTRSLVMLRHEVVKDHCRLSSHLLGIKCIFHQHENVHIVWFQLCSHKRPKNDEPCQLPRTVCQCINVGQPSRHQATLQCACPEMCGYFRKGGVVNPYRQVAIAVKVWPLLHCQKGSYT